MAPAVTPDTEIHDTSQRNPTSSGLLYFFVKSSKTASSKIGSNNIRSSNYQIALPSGVYILSDHDFISPNKYLDKVSIQRKAFKFGFEMPSEGSFSLASVAVGIIKKLNGQIDHINPTEDGGILIEFYQKGIFHMLDIYNVGEIIYVKDAQTKIVENISHNLSKELNSRLG